MNVDLNNIAGILRADLHVRAYNSAVAQQYGLNEAVFLGQLAYWLSRKGKVIDGEVWYYSTYENWTNEHNLPFMSIRTAKRVVKSLSDKGVIKTTSDYNKMPMDNTLWYTIVGWHDDSANLARRGGQSGTPTSCQSGTTNNHKNNNENNSIRKAGESDEDFALATILNSYTAPPKFMGRDSHMKYEMWLDDHVELVKKYGRDVYAKAVSMCKETGMLDGRNSEHVERKCGIKDNPTNVPVQEQIVEVWEWT